MPATRSRAHCRARGLCCDVLVNSAGFALAGPAAALPRAEQMQLLDVNIRALAELTLRFLPGMVARGRGGILNVGSITAYTPGPNMAAYHASKAFVRSFSAALATEVEGTGVTVTCLSPGVVRTAFLDDLPIKDDRVFKLMPRADAVSTARAGWLGFRAGRRLVIPRLIDRILVGAADGGAVASGAGGDARSAGAEARLSHVFRALCAGSDIPTRVIRLR